MKKVKYVGFDISTSIIGVCFLDNEYNLIDLDNIDLKKCKDIFDKSIIVNNRINYYKNNYNFDDECLVSIEEPFQSFSRGFSSAKTISQLNRFNGIVSFIVFNILCIKPLYINVNKARKFLQIKLDKKSNISTKEQIFNWVKQQIPSFEWPTKKLKSGPNKGVVKFHESCYDMSDAFVICKALNLYEEDNK